MSEYPKELYGGMAPHNKTETSRAAAEAATPRAHTIREQVYDEIKASGGRGKTCDELEVLMNRPHTTVSARIRELCLQGRIEPVGRKRKTRWSRDARVYVLTGPRVSCDTCNRTMPYKGEGDLDDLENGWTIEHDVPGAMGDIVFCNVCREKTDGPV
jgi:hypothetical protein